MTRLTIVFDNYAFLEGFPTLWGFACFVETPETAFLFDTGSNGRVLLRNLDRLGIDPKKAEALIISHPHWDHIGGMDSILEVHPDLKLFVPESLSPRLIRDLRTLSAGVTVIGETPTELMPGIFSTGVMGEIGEQAAVIETEKGSAVLTGCAHPGIADIAARAVGISGSPVELLAGGFHLMNADAGEISAVIDALEKLKIRNVCPTHCTGDPAINQFARHFGNRFIRGGTGRTIELL